MAKQGLNLLCTLLSSAMNEQQGIVLRQGNQSVIDILGVSWGKLACESSRDNVNPSCPLWIWRKSVYIRADID